MNPKKQQITNAAYTLFLNKGYNASSIQDILDEAGVSKGTFYNYFTSKAECLIALMESIDSEIRQKRMAIAVGKPANDLDILAEQLCIRIQLNREKNLFALYESIFYSQDEELKNFAKELYIHELNWISTRIIDVFGQKTAQYALENAAIVHGSIQQLTHMWKLTSSEELPTKELSVFVTRRLQAAITQQIDSEDTFIRKTKLPVSSPLETISIETLLQRLESYSKTLGEDEENIQQLLFFLIQEFKEENPRKVLMESVLSTLAQDGSVEAELTSLLEQAWKHLPE